VLLVVRVERQVGCGLFPLFARPGLRRRLLLADGGLRSCGVRPLRMRRVGRPGLAPLQIVRDSVPTLRRAAESPACGARSRACATLRSASSTSPAASTSSPSDGGSCQMVMAPLAVQSFAPYPQSEQQNVGLDRLVTLQRVLAHKGVPERVRARVRAEGVEPSCSFEHRHLKPARMPFRHARSVPILSLGAPKTCRQCGLAWPITDEGLSRAVCGAVRGCEAPHRSWCKRLRDCASTRCAATDGARLAMPTTNSAKASARIRLRCRS
jgi:hypothetical protein